MGQKWDKNGAKNGVQILSVCPQNIWQSRRKAVPLHPTNPTTLLVARPADQGGTFLLYMEYTKQPITLAEQINILKQ